MRRGGGQPSATNQAMPVSKGEGGAMLVLPKVTDRRLLSDFAVPFNSTIKRRVAQHLYMVIHQFLKSITTNCTSPSNE